MSPLPSLFRRDDPPVSRQQAFEFCVLFRVDEALDLPAIDEFVREEFADVFKVLAPACRELAEGEVVFFEAPTTCVGWVVDPKFNQPILPTSGLSGCLGCDTEGIISNFLMKWRQLTDGVIDVDGPLGMVFRVGVALD